MQQFYVEFDLDCDEMMTPFIAVSIAETAIENIRFKSDAVRCFQTLEQAITCLNQ